jgi:hypothetical protein
MDEFNQAVIIQFWQVSPCKSVCIGVHSRATTICSEFRNSSCYKLRTDAAVLVNSVVLEFRRSQYCG